MKLAQICYFPMIVARSANPLHQPVQVPEVNISCGLKPSLHIWHALKGCEFFNVHPLIFGRMHVLGKLKPAGQPHFIEWANLSQVVARYDMFQILAPALRSERRYTAHGVLSLLGVHIANCLGLVSIPRLAWDLDLQRTLTWLGLWSLVPDDLIATWYLYLLLVWSLRNPVTSGRGGGRRSDGHWSNLPDPHYSRYRRCLLWRHTLKPEPPAYTRSLQQIHACILDTSPV